MSITLGPGQSTPAPWINVIANPSFGFQVSAEGCGFTWSVNSREHQLTPWSNDPVTDRPGEAIYLRDEESGEIWCPTALPIRDDLGVYVARHGWGYSRFEHESHGIESELLTYVPVADPIRIARLKLRNTTGRPRRLSVTAYVEWVLGTSRAASAPFVSTEIDPVLGAMFARNPWNSAFAGRVAFLDLGGRQTSWTADRREFIGRNGCLSDPAGLAGTAPLSGAVGAGLDPCGRWARPSSWRRARRPRSLILFGDADGPDQAAALIARYRDADLDAVLAEVREQWEELLGTVQVKTPDRSIDIMLNGWLLYQTIACRLWARSGFYQASGAYGFRDQLQDGMALTAIRPSLTREHLVRAAGRQFAEGDVQHWWLPHSGQGVRTRISDDRVWLAFCVAHYLDVTGDASLLDETAPFPRRSGAEGRRSRQLLRPDRFGQDGERLRALRAWPRREPRARRSRPSPDRRRRLERRHEQGRGGRQGRKRLAGLAFAHVADRLCSGGEVARRSGARDEVARPGFGAAEGARARGLGRRLVSARMVRRRHPDRLGHQR